MMMDRDRLGFWVRFVAIFLAAVFLLSFIFMGIGTNVQYNLFDLIGGGDQQQGGQTVSSQERIERAEKRLEDNPKDPDAIKGLAFVYLEENRPEDAISVLEKGRKDAPKDEEIPVLLGQSYAQQAEATPEGKEKNDLYGKAGDSFAAATEIEPENADAFLLAGQAYDQAGETSQAIKYWNGYLDLEPKGQQARAVEDRIAQLLKGGSTTGESTQP